MELTDIARRIVEEAQRYAGWGYGAGLSVAEQDAQQRIDCSSLTARVLCAVWGHPVGSKLYSWLVLTADALAKGGEWAPIVAVDAGLVGHPVLGEEIDLADLAPGEAALVQEWSRLPTEDDPGRGHAYIVIGSDEPGRVHLLESTSHPGAPNGTRGAGPSWREVDDVGQRWQFAVRALMAPVHDRPTVPISTLGNHRAAVLYPRASAPVSTSPQPSMAPEAGAIPTPTQESSMIRNPIVRKLKQAGYTDAQIEAIRRNTGNDGKPKKTPAEVVEDIAEYAEPGEVVRFLQVCVEALSDGFQPGDLAVIGAAAVELVRR